MVGAIRAEPGIVGQPAPEPRAEFWIDGQGQPTAFSLATQRGKWVHLKFWQSWCPGCHAHGFPTLQKFATAFANEPRVVNVALQTVFEGFGSNGADKVRQTQLRYRLPIVFGHDPGNGPRAAHRELARPGATEAAAPLKQLQEAYGITGVPALGVAGRYLVDTGTAGDMTRGLKEVDRLVDQVRRGVRR